MRPWDVMLAAALEHRDVEEGVACEGTALESRTLKVNGRAFLFLSPKKAYFRLGPSYAEAKQAGGGVKAGGAGWTSLMWNEPCPVSDAVLRRWVDESHDLMGAGPKPTATASLLAMKPNKPGPGTTTRRKRTT